MAIRTKRLYAFSGNMSGLVVSSAVTAGHVWIVKDVHVRNGTGSSTVLIAGGIVVGGAYYTAWSWSNIPAGATEHEGGDFVVLEGGDQLWFQSNNSGTCVALASGAELVP